MLDINSYFWWIARQQATTKKRREEHAEESPWKTLPTRNQLGRID